MNWEFAVIDSDQVNAFVVPGGKVVVYTGLLKLLRGPAMETQVAAVLGHEIAHVVARHSVSPSDPDSMHTDASYSSCSVPAHAHTPR